MKLIKLEKNRIEEFISFCKKNRRIVDDTYLYDEDFKVFDLQKNPTYLILDENESIVAAASLLNGEHAKNSGEARFRIFYSEKDDNSYYEMLLKEILKHTDGLKMIYLFIPTDNVQYVNHFKEMSFNIYRYSLLLTRNVEEKVECSLPEGYSIREYKDGDEKAWCEIRNIGFTKLKGSEMELTPEDIKKSMNSEDTENDTPFILFHGDKPIGIVNNSPDYEDGEPAIEICTLSLRTEYRGKGLGRFLLRYSMNFANSKGFKRAILCVNTENENAKRLYLDEGFEKEEEVVCYKYDL